MNKELFKPTQGLIWKFVIMSAIGAFLFLAPIPTGEGAANIPLGFAIDWLGGLFGGVVIMQQPGAFDQGVTFNLQAFLGLIAISLSLIGTVLAYTVKPAFIENNPKVKEIFKVGPVYIATRVIAFVFIWMIFLGIAIPLGALTPDALTNFTGDVALGLVGALVIIFIFLGPTMPLITDFGLMEFIGIGIRKVVHVLFTLPGRASVNLVASWLGSSVAGVIITADQHERGFYTGREASNIAVNFCVVSLPFTLVVVGAIDLVEHFLLFYAVVFFVCMLLAVLMPRIWPLRGLDDTYLADVGKQIDEDVPSGVTMGQWALSSATERASKASAEKIVKAGLHNYLSIFMELIPIVFALATLGIMVAELTPVFDIIGTPMGLYLNLFGVEGAMESGHLLLVGFIDMYLPAILMSNDLAIETRFIIGALSIIQLIYLAETGALILKSKMPLNIGHLAIIFLMRTIIAVPLVVLLTRLLF